MEFNTFTSYLIYISTVFFSTILVWLSRKITSYKKPTSKKINLFFWMASFCLLWFVMGFRYEVGPDYGNYVRIFNLVTDVGFLGYYVFNFLEPGFLLITFLVSSAGGSAEHLFIVSSFIGLYFFYKSFYYYADVLNPTWMVFIFSSVFYYYFFGIERLFISVSIITYALKYIPAKKNSKFYMYVLFAFLFHISALFMLIVPFLYRIFSIDYVYFKSKKKFVLNIVVVILFLLVLLVPPVFYFINYLAGFLPGRYFLYQNIEVSFSEVLFSIIPRIPFLFLIIISRASRYNKESSYFLFVLLFTSSIIIQFGTLIFPIGRILWYFWISMCFIIPICVKCSSHRIGLNLFTRFISISYAVFYMFYAYLLPLPGRYETMFPYKNILFGL